MISAKESKIWFITFITFLLVIGCKPRHASPPYQIENQIGEPVDFATGKITTVNGINFSVDGKTLYTSNNMEKQFDNERHYAGIFVTEYREGKWTAPEYLDIGNGMDAYHPVLSADNKKLFFNSRSHPDSANTAIKHNIWVIQKTADGWGVPEMVKNVNSNAYDSYPSLAANGNLYFNSDRDGGKGGMDFYVSYFVDDEYSTPTSLDALNSSDVENDLVVDPEERFIIFNRYLHETREIDLFISFNQDEGWTPPRKLDNINSEKWELTPTLSPDGNYFFFELDNQIMQIDLVALIYEDELPGLGRRVRE